MDKITAFGLFLVAGALLIALPFIQPFLKNNQYYGLLIDEQVEALNLINPTPDARVRLVVFGYSGCVTVCPVQLNNLLSLDARLIDQSVEFVFVSLDPDNETESTLISKLALLGDRFVGVRPKNFAEAQSLALAYGGYAYLPQQQSEEIAHSSHLYVVTENWRSKLLYPTPNIDINLVEADIRRLMATL